MRTVDIRVALGEHDAIFSRAHFRHVQYAISSGPDSRECIYKPDLAIGTRLVGENYHIPVTVRSDVRAPHVSGRATRRQQNYCKGDLSLHRSNHICL